MSGLDEQPGGVEDPSVAVELVLVGGAVADPHGLAVGVARPAFERVLAAGAASVEGEQHRKPRPVEPAGVEQPGQEPAGLVDLAHAEERGDADAGVAGPGEAVVPVAAPTDVFGQRGGRRRDRRTRRRVGQQPQREQAADRQVTVGQSVVDVVTPAAPPLLVGFERDPCGIGVDVDEWLALGDREDDSEGSAGRDDDGRRFAGSTRSGGEQLRATAVAPQLQTRIVASVLAREAVGVARRIEDRSRRRPRPVRPPR